MLRTLSRHSGVNPSHFWTNLQDFASASGDENNFLDKHPRICMDSHSLAWRMPKAGLGLLQSFNRFSIENESVAVPAWQTDLTLQGRAPQFHLSWINYCRARNQFSHDVIGAYDSFY
jgi:hypothetical protein